MRKLLDTFTANPTLANAERIAKHIRKHAFATCVLTAQESVEVARIINPSNWDEFGYCGRRLELFTTADLV